MSGSVAGVAVATASRCYLCQADGRALLTNLDDPGRSTGGTWSFLRCTRCELIWLHPRLPAESLPSAYHASYYTHRSVATGRLQPTAWSRPILAARHGYALDSMPSAVHRLLGRFSVLADAARAQVRYLDARPGGRLLDVGCGNGDFLLLMRRLGWDVAGIEPDEQAIAAAAPEIRRALVAGTLETAARELGTFDAITLHHVIEHLDDPVAAVRRCAALLREGGTLVVMTPNAAALGRRLFGRSWLHWDPPRHCFLFTAGSLNEVVRRAGLHIEHVRTTARGARWTWRESRRLQRRGLLRGPPGRARGIEAIAFQLLEHMLLPFGAWGEELVLIATAGPRAGAAEST